MVPQWIVFTIPTAISLATLVIALSRAKRERVETLDAKVVRLETRVVELENLLTNCEKEKIRLMSLYIEEKRKP